MAVRGQLVDQDPDDEPASVLLERIREERARRVAAGELKRAGSRVRSISEEEVPFTLPEGWVWCRLGELVSKMGSGSTPKGGKSAYTATGVPFLRSQNVHDDGLDLSSVAYISDATHEKMAGTKVVAGDLLLNITGGSLGRCAVVTDRSFEGNVSQHVSIIRPILVNPEYAHLVVLSGFTQHKIEEATTGAGRKGLPKYNQEKLLFSLPPLPEQHRIVARTETLLTQLTELETAATQRKALTDRLIPALLNGLGEAVDLSTYWQEMIVPNFGLFTERPAYCDQLRRLILDLAVRGKLVSQEAEDEAASALLERIRAERARRVKAGEIRKGKTLAAVNEEEVPFALPVGWVWCRFDDLIANSNNGVSSGKHNTSGIGKPHLRPMNITTRGEISLDVVKYTEKKVDIALKKNDLFFNNTNSNVMVGKTTLIQNDTEWLYSNHMTRLSCFHELLEMEFVKLYFNQLFESGFFREQCRQYINQASINLTFLKTELLFPLPPLPEQRRIVARAEDLLTRVDALRGAAERRGALREGVLRALMG